MKSVPSHSTSTLGFAHDAPRAPWVFIVALALGFLVTNLPAAHLDDLSKVSTERLEQRRIEIDQTLKELPAFTLRSGVGSIGYRSGSFDPDKEQKAWVQIDLDQTALLDKVVLFPEIWRGFDHGLRADGFPLEFQIRCGTAQDKEGTIVAHIDPEEHLLPRIAPVAIEIPLTIASWVRIEVLELSKRSFDGRKCLQLAEVYLFSGQKNVAYRQRVTASSIEPTSGHSPRHIDNLVDGFTPIIMDVSDGKRSAAYLSPVQIGTQPDIIFDLGEVRAVDQINFHTVEVSDSIPQALPNDFAVPVRMVVEGSSSPGFENPSFLFRYHRRSLYDTGPTICRQFPSHQCRYIRIRIEEAYIDKKQSPPRSEVGFAEVEILSKGVNLALGKPVSIDFHNHHQGRRIEAINDGLNIYGTILPVRTWLESLALRHELETERPYIISTLDERYATQNKTQRKLQWTIAVLLAGTVILSLLSRISRQRAVHQTRERIAADLHDELGANLHALGLLSDLAQKARDQETKLITLLQRIGNLTRRSGKAARYCTDMLEAKELYEDVPEQIERCSRRFLSDMEYRVDIHGKEFLEKLSARQRIDLCLFHKECMANILRHAEASVVSTELKASEQNVRITVTDNGLGLAGKEIPKSIQRRSSLLGSKVRHETPENGGTRIILTFKFKKFGIL